MTLLPANLVPMPPLASQHGRDVDLLINYLQWLAEKNKAGVATRFE